MSYTPLNPLPAFPSRLGDPDNFLAEGVIFLAALTDLVSEMAVLAGQINALDYHAYDWGSVAYTPLDLPVIPLLTMIPAATDVGTARTGKSDATLATIHGMVNGLVDSINAAAEYVQEAQDYTAALIGDQPPKILVPAFGAAPTRAQPQAAFNMTMGSFLSSINTSVTALNSLTAQIYQFLFAPEDYGLLGTPIDAIDDYGVLP